MSKPLHSSQLRPLLHYSLPDNCDKEGEERETAIIVTELNCQRAVHACECATRAQRRDKSKPGVKKTRKREEGVCAGMSHANARFGFGSETWMLDGYGVSAGSRNNECLLGD